MKILHTADWHVGKTLRGQSRAEDHRAALAEVAAIASDEKVDLILVVGDLFESAAPSPESEEIVYKALLDLGETGAVVAVVSGNHDNYRRLEAVAPLLQRCEVIVACRPLTPGQGGVREFETALGERVRLALLPFVSKRNVVKAQELMSQDAAENVGQYAERLARIVGVLTAGFEPDAVNVVAAHALVTGGQADESDRGIQSIFDYWISPMIFPASAHYVALGDLHHCQRIDSPAPMWYSGSPIQLAASDIDDEKCVLVIEAKPGHPAEVRRLPIKAGRRLRLISGSLSELEALRGTTGSDFVFVRVNEQPRAGLNDEVRRLFPNTVSVMPPPAPEGSARRATDRLAGGSVSPHQLFDEYLMEKNAKDGAVLALFDRLYEEISATDTA